MESERLADEDTRFGGAPDVPASFEWPRRNGTPLAFIAQIDFSEDNERLLFFYDAINAPTGDSPEDRGSSHVVVVPNEGLRRAEPPQDLPADFRYREIAMSISLDVVLPDYKSKALKELGISDNDIRRLEELENQPNEMATTSHHLLGYPSLVTEDMESSVQLAANGLHANDPKSKEDPRFDALVEAADHWMLLFQCDNRSRRRMGLGERRNDLFLDSCQRLHARHL